MMPDARCGHTNGALLRALSISLSWTWNPSPRCRIYTSLVGLSKDQ